MEQRTPFIGGMPVPGQEVDDAQLQDALYNMLKQAAQNGRPSLELFALFQQRRAVRLDTAAKALAKELGNKYPDVVAMQDTARALAQFNARINTQIARSKSWPKVQANEWGVFGTVSNPDNSPAVGVNVRVFDRERKFDNLLGKTPTDDNGDFSIIYNERVFKAMGGNIVELFVMVEDVKGNQVYSSRDSIRFNSGQSEYFAIQLVESGRTIPPRPTKTGDAASKPTARANPKKN